ncbi:hypothetical protein CSC81_11485 [Tenacibaculum discolor]|uniref:Uncharacterized protein n=1 Tax=Tenacibaculum discolor TaxID=361581 RepID=A0A2G1BSJ5_9FLAO|nr:hypothetical protein CSC81_11485 [Tenacibaculum discolor]PHO01423.1 hypothetical protein CSC82_23695 [Rhodobacteraceae bacterium 4F10]RLK06919.1 hypothetical protein C8N27_0482 [Tenacibaculum discolor]
MFTFDLKKNMKHLKTRGLIFLIICISFISFGIYISDSNQRSCLGNPIILPYTFLGVPSIFLLGILDVIVLAFSKKLKFYKAIFNLSLMLLSFLIIFLFM